MMLEFHPIGPERVLVFHIRPTLQRFFLNLDLVVHSEFAEGACLTVPLLARLFNFSQALSCYKKPYGLHFKGASLNGLSCQLWRQYCFDDFAIMQCFEAAMPF